MNRWLKGYMTVEASFIVPLVLVLYVLIIVGGFFLYDRCVMSQDQYLLAFRGSRFTYGAENIGEVIYGEMVVGVFDRQYVEERVSYKQSFYPLFEKGEVAAGISENEVSVYGRGFRGLLEIRKNAKQLNLLEIVREKRREKYARNKVL